MTHVVIGAGLSGLVAAVELASQGREVLVLEASGALGGRAQTHRSEGFALNLGPHALYPGAERQLAELGVNVTGGVPKRGLTMEVGDRIAPLPGDAVTLLGNGALGWNDKLRVGWLLGRLGWIDADPLDRVTVGEWLDAMGLQGTAKDVALAVVRISTYVNASDRMSAGVAIRQIRGALDGVRYLDGGWATIVDGLLERARELGVVVRSRAKVERLEVEAGRVVGVMLRDGERIATEGVVLTLSPKASVRLLGEHARPSLATFAADSVAVRAACLDVALRRLPRRHPSLILGTNEPTYVSIHSNVAALAPTDGGVIHVARYLAPDERVDGATRAQLEGYLDRSQPGWRDEVEEVRWSPAMTVMHAIPEARDGGLAGRPTVASAGPTNLALAGDWVGPEGLLADACVTSARAAARWIARGDREAQGVTYRSSSKVCGPDSESLSSTT
ncbi:MAG: NAD(P)/FAD-dependent oxidoreductase [Sandaracinaceae bacterium]|nr:NAD(P)/FAD-dependent oxidoreductase [Sandaracinaceae bacterium]